jgi:hypothetical protein
LDVALCEQLAARASSGDVPAWKALIERVWPPLRSLVESSRSMGSFARSEDHVYDVLARIVDRFGRRGGRGLGLYPAWHQQNPDKTFDDWIRIVTIHEIRRRVRAELAKRALTGAEKLPSVNRVLNEIAMSPAIEQLGVRPPTTAAQTARELLELAHARLSRERYRALGMWLTGASFDEIAQELALEDAALAERQVRGALAVVRRFFAAGTGKRRVSRSEAE